MAKVRHLLQGSASTPIVSPVLGGTLANSGPVKSVLRGQDSVLLNGRRIVAAQSLDQAAFGFPDSDDPFGATKTHHSADVEREVLRAQCHVTPGHFLRVGVLALPSGETQTEDPVSYGEIMLYEPTGAQGRVIVEVVWTDRDGLTETTTHEVAIAGSSLEYGGLPAGSAGWWSALRTGHVSLVAPPGINTTDTLARWSRHVGASITVKHAGGVRVVDFVVTEHPVALALDTSDDASYWVSGLNANGTPDGAALDFTHPLQRLDETQPDPRGGTWTMLDVAHAQANRLGPILMSWSAWHEADSTLDRTTLPSRSTSSTSFVGLLDETQTSYDESRPGWSFSCGAYARRWAANHPLAMLGRDGSIPVRVWVYGSTVVGGTLRLQTAPWSWIDVPITGHNGWYSAYGHLRVGRGPGDDVVPQVFLKSVHDTTHFRAILVEYAGDWESAV